MSVTFHQTFAINLSMKLLWNLKAFLPNSRKHTKKEKTYKNRPKTIKKMVIGTYISIITSNVNGLNAQTKRHRLSEWAQKQDLYVCCL